MLATDVDTGEPVVFRRATLRDAVRASCSFPGVFPPMVLDGRRLYDGGISEVVPGAAAPARWRASGRGGGGGLQQRRRAGRRPTRSWPWPCAPASPCCAGARAASWPGADLVIAPAMGESGWMRPVKIPAFFAAGEEALAEALPELRRLLRG